MTCQHDHTGRYEKHTRALRRSAASAGIVLGALMFSIGAATPSQAQVLGYLGLYDYLLNEYNSVYDSINGGNSSGGSSYGGSSYGGSSYGGSSGAYSGGSGSGGGASSSQPQRDVVNNTGDQSVDTGDNTLLEGGLQAIIGNSASLDMNGDSNTAIHGGEQANITNSGTINGAGGNVRGILAELHGTITNTGDISLTGDGANAIEASNEATITSSGRIHVNGGGAHGVIAGSSSTFTNNGGILAEGQDATSVLMNAGASIQNNSVIASDGQHALGIHLTSLGSVVNNAAIAASGSGGTALRADGKLVLDNAEAAAIIAEDDGIAVDVHGAESSIANKGRIEGGMMAINLSGIKAQLINKGSIAARAGHAISLGGEESRLENHGDITGHDAGVFISADKATIVNQGGIEGGVSGIDAGGDDNSIVNEGHIKGGTSGIRFSGGGNTVDNVGSIEGDDESIHFTGKNNLLVVHAASRFKGRIGLGEETAIRITAPVSMVMEVDDASKAKAAAGSAPVAAGGAHVASLGSTPLAHTAVHSATLTGGIMDAVRNGMIGLGGGGGARITAAAGTGPLLQYEYGASPQTGIGIMGEGFYRTSKSTTSAGDHIKNDAHGGLFGLHYRFTPQVLAGMFIGGGTGLVKDHPSGMSALRNKTDTRSIFGGAYARWQDEGFFLAGTLSGGGIDFKSDRAILNIMTGSVEHARAKYRGYFLSGEVSLGTDVNTGLSGLHIQPEFIGQFGFLHTNAYSESGSAAAISAQDQEQINGTGRMQFTAYKDIQLDSGVLRAYARGGVQLRRNSNTAHNVQLLGQTLSVTPGLRKYMVSAIAGGGMSMRFDNNVQLYGNVELKRGQKDKLTDVMARVGLKYEL